LSKGGTATFWSSAAQGESTRVLLVRHGRVAWNARAAYTGWTDLPLDDRGEAEAKLVADRLKKAEITAVYSSDLIRARSTAETIAKPHGITITIDPAIKEINYGEWEGLNEADIRERYGDKVFDAWKADPENVVIPGGETFGKLHDRVVPAVARIAASHPGETIVIVAHRSVNRVLICAWLGMKPGRYKEIEQGNAAINSAVFTGNRVVLETVNDVGHIRL
jgi:alpha-ribazole phosphatase